MRFMNQTLAEFIARRRLEIEEEISPLQEKLTALRHEREQLKKAAIAAGLETKSLAEPDKPRRKLQTGTIKEAVIAILAETGDGLNASDLLVKLNERNSSTLIRSSLSPQLSRLKQDGYILLTGRIWHLPSQKIEPPDNNLFAGELSEGSKPDHEAQDVKATSGGGA
jgi:hypothetical protein